MSAGQVVSAKFILCDSQVNRKGKGKNSCEDLSPLHSCGVEV